MSWIDHKCGSADRTVRQTVTPILVVFNVRFASAPIGKSLGDEVRYRSYAWHLHLPVLTL